jgi:GNAT superfamily N-acetyltransferase
LTGRELPDPEAGPDRCASTGTRASSALIRDARPGDVPALLKMFAELADYEHLTHELRATEQQLHAALFGPRPAVEALIAEQRDTGAAIGYAMFFPTFSTFLASTGVWLEDLFVRHAHRRGGIGRALLAAVAARMRERGGERLEWAALDWNEPALSFYRGLGARTMEEWITHRLTGAELGRLAAECPRESP